MTNSDKYWTIHGLFYGTKTFHDYAEAMAEFERCGSTWDSDYITMYEHRLIHRKLNKKEATNV